MYRTPIRFLGLESSVFLISAIHIVDDQSERERSLDYISGVEMAEKTRIRIWLSTARS